MGAPGIGEPFDVLTASKLAGYTRAQGKIVRVYIQVQKVYVLYLFLGNPRILG
jgi:hypothetical protein